MLGPSAQESESIRCSEVHRFYVLGHVVGEVTASMGAKDVVVAL
jgi:hypothetical protein